MEEELLLNGFEQGLVPVAIHAVAEEGEEPRQAHLTLGLVEKHSDGQFVLKALKQKFPRCASWRVLEDNDPAGFKSSKDVKAKADAGIKVFSIPRRSPDLNVCDYALWKMVDKKTVSRNMGGILLMSST